MTLWIAAWLTMNLAVVPSPELHPTTLIMDLAAWEEPAPPREKDISRAMKAVYAEINNARPVKLTRAWRKDKGYRILFLSLCDGKSPAKVLVGAGPGYGKALAQILEQLHNRAVLKHARWVKLEIMASLGSHQYITKGDPLALEYSLEGLVDKSGRWAILPGEIVAQEAVMNQLVKGDRLSAALRVGGRAVPELYQEFQDPGLAVRSFRTFAYFSNGTETEPLYRDHRFFETIDKPVLEQAVAEGVRYLVEATGPTGEMAYTALKRGEPQYSLARHGGTLFSLADVYKDYPSPQLKNAIDQATRYLLTHSKPFPFIQPSGHVLVERGAVKLTVMALGVLALVRVYEIDPKPEYLARLREYAHYIAESQLPNGRFYDRRNFDDGKWRKEMESMYAPGEAILALTELYGIDPNPRWLEIAEKGAAYLMERQGSHIPLEQLEHDHWLLYALNAISRHNPTDAYYQHAMRLTTAIDQLQRKQHAYPDWVGSYYTPPRSTPTATRVEGLLAAFEMAVRSGRADDAKRIWEIAQRSIRFQLQMQYWSENAMHFPYPERILGGFRGGYDDNHIRIDFVQHNIAAMLTMVRMYTAGHNP